MLSSIHRSVTNKLFPQGGPKIFWKILKTARKHQSFMNYIQCYSNVTAIKVFGDKLRFTLYPIDSDRNG